MTTANENQGNQGNQDQKQDKQEEPAGGDPTYAEMDSIASSSGRGHDRRPDLVFLEKIRMAKESNHNAD